MTPFDEQMMRRALELAERGRGRVEPNPVVGAVVALGETIVGEGHHEFFGAPHAEVNALTAAGDRARGATLYVTLEPCCHHGKTPPCTDAIAAAGVSRVVAAMQDPFHAVSGGGFAALRSAGIKLEVGLCETQALRLNAPFVKLNLRGLPFFIAKWAMTLDGKIATVTGDSKWVSSDASRNLVQEMRNRADAVVVGVRTAVLDDPLLTCRLPGGRNPRRIIIDTQARLPLTSRLVRTVNEAPVWVACGPSAPEASLRALSRAGCRIIQLPEGHHRAEGPERRRGVSVAALAEILGRELITNVLVEGGAAVLASFFEAKLVDRVKAFIAPKLLGGEHAPGAIGGAGVRSMGQAWTLGEITVTRIAEDVLIEGDVQYTET